VELDALLGAYPGWLAVVYRWTGGRALFRVSGDLELRPNTGITAATGGGTLQNPGFSCNVAPSGEHG